MLLCLIYLYKNIGKLTSKEELTHFINDNFGHSNDIQPRHLKYMGWDVRLSGKANDKMPDGSKIPNGYYLLAQIFEPNSDFLFENQKRTGRVNAKDFDELCKVYDNCCGHCGKKGNKFEKGHLDPDKPFEIENILPLCTKCNNWQSKDAVFDENGRIKYITSFRFIKDAPKHKKEQIYDELSKDLGHD